MPTHLMLRRTESPASCGLDHSESNGESFPFDIQYVQCREDFFSAGLGENLGWVLDPKNAEVRAKLRTTFAAWYDFANNENDENCCFLAIRLTKGTLRINHGETFYHFDFMNKSAT